MGCCLMKLMKIFCIIEEEYSLYHIVYYPVISNHCQCSFGEILNHSRDVIPKSTSYTQPWFIRLDSLVLCWSLLHTWWGWVLCCNILDFSLSLWIGISVEELWLINEGNVALTRSENIIGEIKTLWANITL